VIEGAILTAIHARLTQALQFRGAGYRPLVVDGVELGWVDDARAERLAGFGPALFRVDAARVTFMVQPVDRARRSAAFAEVAAALHSEGALPGWRGERVVVAPEFGGPVAFMLERAAARWFGVRTHAAHVNGVVDVDGRRCMWFARRSLAKAVDPGLLDNLVGGGITEGLDVADTVVKEAWEEAGIAEPLARRARPVGRLQVRRKRADGLQRETIFVHDLELAPAFIPANQDSEAIEHRLVDLAEAGRIIAQASGPEETTVDAALVVLDCLLRHGAVATGTPEHSALLRLRDIGAGHGEGRTP